MRISKFTSKKTLVNYIKDNTHFKTVEVSKLYDGDEITIDTDVLFQIRTTSRITLHDLGIIGILHKDVGITFSNGMLLLTWNE